MKMYLIPSLSIKSSITTKNHNNKLFNIDKSLINNNSVSVVSTNTNDLLIVPANVLNLKFILPNLIPIFKSYQQKMTL